MSMNTWFKNLKVSHPEMVSGLEKFGYGLVAVMVDYAANHLGYLPLSPIAVAVLTPIIYWAKSLVDGKVA